jgi:8-hydroxy-5-deazaflavin:NADPH oxidoreductase
MNIGIVGAGHIGQAIATIAGRYGYRAMLSNARGPETISELASALGCEVGTAVEAVAFGDLVAVAIPLKAYPLLPIALFDGKIVMDTGNYYPERDGRVAELDSHAITTSGLLARQLPGASVVKAFNAILAAQIITDGRPAGTSGRRALPIAGDDGETKQIVATFIDRAGFDTVDVGTLADSWKIERARPAYCIPMNKAHLAAVLQQTTRESFVPEGSWRRS